MLQPNQQECVHEQTDPGHMRSHGFRGLHALNGCVVAGCCMSCKASNARTLKTWPYCNLPGRSLGPTESISENRSHARVSVCLGGRGGRSSTLQATCACSRTVCEFCQASCAGCHRRDRRAKSLHAKAPHLPPDRDRLHWWNWSWNCRRLVGGQCGIQGHLRS